MIHVVHVVTRTNIGGVSSYIGNLVRSTEAFGVRHTVIRGTPEQLEGDYFQNNPLKAEIIDIPTLRRPLRPIDDLRSLLALWKAMRKLCPDIVHTHMAKAGLLGRVAAFLAGIEIRIHTFHGHLLTGYFSKPAVFLIVQLERALQCITSWSIVNGENVRRDLVGRGVISLDTSTNIPPGVLEIAAISKDNARQFLQLPLGTPLVGFVGRLTQIKRPDRFIALARAIPDAYFVVCGDGPLLSSLKLSANDLRNITFIGWLADTSVLYSAIDVIVLTSENEAVPTVLIEASSAGVPSIATDVGSVSEIVVDDVTGFIADGETALLTLTTRLLNSEDLRAQFGRAARQRALSEFGLGTFARRHTDLYSNLVHKTGISTKPRMR